jgi:hypothetical protein
MSAEDRVAGRSERLAAMALASSVLGGLCFVAAVVLYNEPKSFYTNFVLLPSIGLMAAGTAIDLVAIVLALLGLKGSGRKLAWRALTVAVLVPLLVIGIIQLVLRD